MTIATVSQLDSPIVGKMNSDLRAALRTLPLGEAGVLVRMYYDQQDIRLRTHNRIRAYAANGDPNAALLLLASQAEALEKRAALYLKHFASAYETGRWSMSIRGMGPVMTAGLLSEIDTAKTPNVSALCRFFGLVQGIEWNKGEKRPWNAFGKKLCFLIGNSFVKVSRRQSFYGLWYRYWRWEYQRRNDAGQHAESAARLLRDAGKHAGPASVAAWKQGKLPARGLHMMAMRKAEVLFLHHFYAVRHREVFGCETRMPYAVTIMGHDGFIPDSDVLPFEDDGIVSPAMLAHLPFRLWATGRVDELNVVKGEDEDTDAASDEEAE